MGKRIAILQSNYIPWKGYFDIINSVDEFILYDDVQFTKNDWRNRNKIKMQSGLKWLSIPVKHSTSMRIRDVKVINNNWRKKHWESILINYAKGFSFKEYKEEFEQLYLNSNEIYLSKINYSFIEGINKILGIKTVIKWSSDYKLEGDKTERLINLCIQSNATEYLSGPSAKNYLDERFFLEENIKLIWMDYNNYPTYRQLFPPFEHFVSIVDLILNEGTNSSKYMKSFGEI